MVDSAYTEEWQNKWLGVEDDSWWYKYRICVFLWLAKKYFRKSDHIVDIGGSNGYNALMFQNKGYDITLIEPTRNACDNASARGVNKIHNGTLEDYSKKVENFLILDVLEHIKEDGIFLETLHERINERSVGIISVPAFMQLWSSEDDVDGHYRRYTIESLSRVLHDRHFEIIYINYLYRFLWMPIYFRRHLLEKFRIVKRADERSTSEDESVTKKQFVSKGFVDYCLKKVIAHEFKLLKQGKRFRYGSSIVCIVKKRDE